MKRPTLAISLVILCLVPGAALAFCPTSLPNEIFCDDFETYCADGGYPEPGQPRCQINDRDGGREWVQSVWYQTSDGTTMTLEGQDPGYVNPNILSGVTSGRYYAKIDLGQQCVRDWVDSPPVGEPDQVLNIQRFIGNVFGSEYAAVAGSDDKPLVLEFLTGANVGKLLYSSGYIEVAMGKVDNPLNRANTDYAKWPKLPCCGGVFQKGPWPLICAQGDPIPEEAGCPSSNAGPPPIHQAIAVGALNVLDANPCHCVKMDPRPKNEHLALFDGQLWWSLKKDSPVASTGEILSGPMPPPADIVAGDFALSSEGNRAYNAIKLTIKSTTIKVQLTAWVKSKINGATYVVTNTMDNIPRRYTGAFDSIRSGVGPGCELVGQDWDTCSSIAGRYALWTPEGWFVDFDNLVLHGGYGDSVEGACCNAVDGACGMTLQNECPGRWTKSGQTCGETLCCPQIYGDTNFDGSADMVDFAFLQTCINTGGGNMKSACRCLDFNGDNAIGTADIQHFVDCANGPSLPAETAPECAGRGW